MDRSRVAVGLLALLAVLALGVAAATLETTSGGTAGAGAGDTDRTGGGSTGFAVQLPNSSPIDPTLSWLLRHLFAALVIAATVVSVVIFYREYGARGVAGIVAVAVFFGVLLYLAVEVFQGFGDPLPRGENNTSILPGGDATWSDERETGTPTQSPPMLAGLFLMALLGGGLLLVRATGDDTRTPEPQPAETPEVERLGRVAGEAADRIARGAVTDNEVYRAWREMTELLDVSNPESSTPGEFADAAVEAGLDREDVEELTALFAAVRYGDREPTAEREERAVAALRRIEEGYA